MNKTLSIPILLLAFLAIACFAYFSVLPGLALGSAPSGLPASVATSTTVTATAGVAKLLFATSTNCAARSIGAQVAINITFSDINGQRPTNADGHPQAASTTVAYDGGLYGCGAVYVFPLVTGVITGTESR